MKAARRFSGVNCKNKSSDFVCKSMVVYFGGRKRVCRISTYFLLLNQLYFEPVFFFFLFFPPVVTSAMAFFLGNRVLYFRMNLILWQRRMPRGGNG